MDFNKFQEIIKSHFRLRSSSLFFSGYFDHHNLTISLAPSTHYNPPYTQWRLLLPSYLNIRSPPSFRTTVLRRSNNATKRLNDLQACLSTQHPYKAEPATPSCLTILRGPISLRQLCPRYRSPQICRESVHGIHATPPVGRLPRRALRLHDGQCGRDLDVFCPGPVMQE